MMTAQKDYADRTAQAKSLIERLSKALDNHAVQADRAPENWGFAGDVGAFNATLIQALGRLGGLTAQEQALHQV